MRKAVRLVRKGWGADDWRSGRAAAEVELEALQDCSDGDCAAAGEMAVRGREEEVEGSESCLDVEAPMFDRMEDVEVIG